MSGPKRKFDPPKKELEKLYQKLSMKDIADHYGVGETVVHKRIHEHGIVLKGVGKGGHRKEKGRIFSESHRKNISKALQEAGIKGERHPNWQGGDVEIVCRVCGNPFYAPRPKKDTAIYCSVGCRGKGQTERQAGEGNSRWKGGVREKPCEGCGAILRWKSGQSYINFTNRKFCTKECADKNGFRYSGIDHPNYREDARRRNRNNRHAKWARDVISRDNATCQKCGDSGVELHAHHLESYADSEDKRFDINNGMTLCYLCHWKVHGLDIDEETLAATSGTKRGQNTLRWEGKCEWCGTFISKRLSDAKAKKHHFCSRSCAGKFNAAKRSPEFYKKIAEKNKGRKLSEERKRQIGIASKKAWAKKKLEDT